MDLDFSILSPTQIASNGENLPPRFVVGRFFRPKNKQSLNKTP